MQIPEDQLKWCLARLGVTPGDFENARRLPSLAQAEEALSHIKTTAKRQYRQASRELHPDLNGNDPEKTEQFKVLTHVMEQIEKLKIQPPQPQPVRWVMVVRVR